MATFQTSSGSWDHLRSRIEELVQSDRAPAVETLAVEFPYIRANEQLWLDCIYTEFFLREEQGQCPTTAEFLARFPEYEVQLRRLFEIHAALERPSLFGSGLNDQNSSSKFVGSKLSTYPTVHASQSTNSVITGLPDGNTAAKWIGGYRILHKIASGGMGVVYKAHHPQLDRVAAVKLIKSAGLDDGGTARRFELEARAAAKLDHPGIVPVYEIGQHEGRLFLAMAYVDGESLSQRVLKSPLEPLLAARIIRQVAEAVHYAHQCGIVHRDLKPQNILLTAADQPRVTDFGLAKHQGSDSSLTGTGDVLGTPSYMPPEQAEGKVETVGPLSDVYSLGATLYAVLTGRPPFQAASTVETLFQVLNQEPLPPRALNPSIPVDLETICLKALQKDPTRRYDTAQAFADDLVRFQNGEAILARPIRRTERAWRWCRKNLAIATLSTTAAMLLLTITVVSSVAYFRERRFAAEKEILAEQESRMRQQAEVTAAEKAELAIKNERLAEEANAEREKAVHLADEKTHIANEKTEVSNFLVTLFRTSDPLDLRGMGLRKDQEGELTARDVLERALKRLSATENSGLTKSIRAALLNTLGDVQRSRGELDAAETLLTEARTIWDETLTPEDPATSEILLNLGKLRYDQGRYEEAEPLLRKSLQLCEPKRALAPLDITEVELYLSLTLTKLWRTSEAKSLINNVIQVRSARLAKDSIEIETARFALIQVLYAERRFDEVNKIIAENMDSREVSQIYMQFELSEKLRREGKHEEAASSMKNVMDMAANRIGSYHPLLFFMHIDLADILYQQGDRNNAIQEFRRAVEVADRSLKDHPAFIDPGLRFAEEIWARGNFQEAEQLTFRVIQIAQRPAKSHPNLSRAEIQLAAILKEQGRYAEAEKWAKQALVDSRRTWADPKLNLEGYDRCVIALCGLLSDQGKFEEAERYFRTRHSYLSGAKTEQHILRQILREQGREDEAQHLEEELLAEVRPDPVGGEQTFDEVVQAARKEFPPLHPEFGLRLLSLSHSLMKDERWNQAETALREGGVVMRHAYGTEYEIVWYFQMKLAEAVWMTGKPEEARQLAKEAFERFCGIYSEEHPRLIDVHANYARLCQLFGDMPASETHYRTAVELASSIFPAAHPLRWKTVSALADVLIAAGKPAEAKDLLTAYLAETTPLFPEKSPRLADLRARAATLP